MPGIDSATWVVEPHTKAKHQILEEYLKRWFPIVGSTSEKVVYLDGFAGPGIYSNGEDGSPVIAIRTASEHRLVKKIKKAIFEFIENDPERAKMLRQVLAKKFPRLPEKFQYEVVEAKFATSLEHMLSNIEKEGANLAPTFAFIDPFGFSGIPMDLITRILGYNKCEVLITFMSSFIIRFNDERRQNALDSLFGTEEWREIHEISNPDEKRRFIVDLYAKQLQKHGGVDLYRTFEMIGDKNQIIYHLVFATKNYKGLKAMKEAMMKIDSYGTYRFSDRTDPYQTSILDHSEQKWILQAASLVYESFRGKTATVEKVEEFVLGKTPFILKKSVLKHLEEESKITNVEGRKRKGSFPDRCKIEFA